MDFLITSVVFAIVFILLLIFLTSRGGQAEQSQSLIRRMARPEDDLTDVDVTRRDRPREEGVLVLLYRLNLLRKLEENMWQAGIYMRVSEMLLIILLMFAAGIFLGEAIWHDLLFALALVAPFPSHRRSVSTASAPWKHRKRCWHRSPTTWWRST